MDSRGDDACCRDSSASLVAGTAPLGIFFPRALIPGIQGQRKPRRRPLVPWPRCPLPGNLVTMAGDWLLLQRERDGPLSGVLPLFLG